MEKKLPLVTVVTPTFNIIKNGREDYFRECVDSVKKQSYKNIEHIIIDNVSDDGTIELLKELGLTFFSEPDTGIFNAFNKGVQKAKGKYVIFLGSDDFYHSTFGIEMSVKALEENDADFSYSEALFTLDNITTHIFEVNILNTFKVIPYSHQTVLCKREALLDVPFDESYKVSGDVHWNIRMIMKQYQMVNANFNFAYNRFTGTCTSNCEEASKETDRMYKELFHDIYSFSDEILEEMSFFRIFPKELDEHFSTYFEDPEEYLANAQEYNETQELYKNHKLLYSLIKRSKELNGNVISDLEKKFNLPAINDLLYTRLDEESQKIFVDFFLKRYGDLNVIDESEEKYLDDLFTRANTMTNARANAETPIDIKLNGKDYKYFSIARLNLDNLTKDQELLIYFDIVHTFFLNEYDLDDFRPKDGEVILDCGAYTGDTALMFNAIYPNSPIYSFECDDDIYPFLTKNIEINKLKKVRTVKTFLADKTKDQNMKIDDFVKRNDIKNVGLIKFDIEGAERFALLGAIDTIKKYKPILMIPIYHLPDDSAVIPKILDDLGMPAIYKLKWIEKRLYGVDCSLFVKFI